MGKKSDKKREQGARKKKLRRSKRLKKRVPPSQRKWTARRKIGAVLGVVAAGMMGGS